MVGLPEQYAGSHISGNEGEIGPVVPVENRFGTGGSHGGHQRVIVIGMAAKQVVGDLEGMMKAKAMAGMSGNFYDTKTNQTFSGTYIDDQLGINDQTRVDAWKNLTDFSSTLSTMLSGFGAKVLTSPKFLDASNIFLNKLFDAISRNANS